MKAVIYAAGIVFVLFLLPPFLSPSSSVSYAHHFKGSAQEAESAAQFCKEKAMIVLYFAMVRDTGEHQETVIQKVTQARDAGKIGEEMTRWMIGVIKVVFQERKVQPSELANSYITFCLNNSNLLHDDKAI